MKIDGDQLQMSVDELAGMLGLSVRRIQQLEKSGEVKSIAHGVYDAIPSVAGYCELLRSTSRSTPLATQERETKIRLQTARANLAELQHGELRGELIRRSARDKQDAALAAVLRNNLESIPDRIAPLLAASADLDECHHLLTNEIRHSLDGVIDAMQASEVETADLDIVRAEALKNLDDADDARQ